MQGAESVRLSAILARLATFVATALTCIVISPAWAQTDVYVAKSGLDTNTGAISAPLPNIAAGIQKVAAGDFV